MSIKLNEYDKIFNSKEKKEREFNKNRYTNNMIINYNGITGRILYFIDNNEVCIYTGDGYRQNVRISSIKPLERKDNNDYNSQKDRVGKKF